MKIAIVYDTRTGRTMTMARAMGSALQERGHECTVKSINEADPAETANAHLICAGCPTHGLFIILQHPTKEWVEFVEGLGDLGGKKAVVFTTYMVATGRMLKKMTRAMEKQGAEVVGRFRSRSPAPGDDFAAFVAGLE
jgi:flavodoxin